MQFYLVEGVNPQPWTASEGAIGRRNGKAFIHFHKPEQLRNYQEALKDEFQRQNPHAVEASVDKSLEVSFYFWRQVEVGEFGQGKRTRHANYADVTNLQKATEDALQHILYENDRSITAIRSVIVEQGLEVSPRILVVIGDYDDKTEAKWAETLARSLHAPEAVQPRRPDDTFDVGEFF